MCLYFNAVVPTETGLKIDRQESSAKYGDCGVPLSQGDDSRETDSRIHTPC